MKTRLLLNIFPDISDTGKILRVNRKVIGYKMEMNIFLGEGVDCISFYCV